MKSTRPENFCQASMMFWILLIRLSFTFPFCYLRSCHYYTTSHWILWCIITSQLHTTCLCSCIQRECIQSQQVAHHSHSTLYRHISAPPWVEVDVNYWWKLNSMLTARSSVFSCLNYSTYLNACIFISHEASAVTVNTTGTCHSVFRCSPTGTFM